MIHSKLDSKEQVTLKKISKNNHVVLDAIVLQSQDNSCISPLIYLESWYQHYCAGESIENIADEILNLGRQTPVLSLPTIQALMDFSAIREHLMLKLINYAENEDLLKLVPYRTFLDLALICCILMETQDNSYATILITKHHLETWKLSEEALFASTFEMAKQKHPALLCTLSEALQSITDTQLLDMLPPCPLKENDMAIPMYVLTNSISYFGAAVIAYTDIVADFARHIDKDLYLLPSSIHEFIIVPVSAELDWFSLSEVIQQINSTDLDHTDWLSNHAYYYSRKANQIFAEMPEEFES